MGVEVILISGEGMEEDRVVLLLCACVCLCAEGLTELVEASRGVL